MRLTTLASILALAGVTFLAQAAFDPRMDLQTLEEEMRALYEAKQPVETVAVTALDAKVEAGKATAAMVLAGYPPHSVVRAMLAAGAFPIPVCAGLLVAGVPIDRAREYFQFSATGQPEACPPAPFGEGSSPSDLTAGVSGTGSALSVGGGSGSASGPVASPN